MAELRSGDRCPRTGVTIGCPEIDRREREAFERANPWYRVPERLTLGKQAK